MQKSVLFQSYLLKQQSMSQLLCQSKNPQPKQIFNHFEGVSQPTLLKAERSSIYLTHLNSQFREQLREFVHSEESYKQTINQLIVIGGRVENQRNDLEKQYKNLKIQLHTLQLQADLLNNHNQNNYQKICMLQQQNKSAQTRYIQQQRQTTQIQQQTQFQKTFCSQLENKNHKLLQRLRLQSNKIICCTQKFQHLQQCHHQRQTKLKSLFQSIKSLEYTIECQDQQLTNNCDAIQFTLSQQSDHINNMDYQKEKYSIILTNKANIQKELQRQLTQQQELADCVQDLAYDLKRVQMERHTQQDGIDQQYWKIQTESQRLLDNQAKLLQLKQYLQNLIKKNQIMQQTLQKQIIEDHTIKKIFDSKYSQPIGKKTKTIMLQFQDKQYSTSQSFKSPFKQQNLNRIYQPTSFKKTAKKVPQLMEWIGMDNQHSRFIGESRVQDGKKRTGFTYANTQARYQYNY